MSHDGFAADLPSGWSIGRTDKNGRIVFMDYDHTFRERLESAARELDRKLLIYRKAPIGDGMNAEAIETAINCRGLLRKLIRLNEQAQAIAGEEAEDKQSVHAALQRLEVE